VRAMKTRLCGSCRASSFGPDAAAKGLPMRSCVRRSSWPVAKVPRPSEAGRWPDPNRRSDDAFVGREQVFDDLGFSCFERPSPERVIMRLELSGTE
jgi:hypothetical protein